MYRGGHTAVCAYLRSIGCTWRAKACTAAAQGGHPDTLRWLRQHACAGCTGIRDYVIEQGEVFDADVLTDVVLFADISNQQQVVEWLRRHGAHCVCTSELAADIRAYCGVSAAVSCCTCCSVSSAVLSRTVNNSHMPGLISTAATLTLLPLLLRCLVAGRATVWRLVHYTTCALRQCAYGSSSPLRCIFAETFMRAFTV
eukprot:14566-Heterococcus_DN1.PRE.1